jgi:hypothetical protein
MATLPKVLINRPISNRQGVALRLRTQGVPSITTHRAAAIGTYQWVDNWGNKICRSL